MESPGKINILRVNIPNMGKPGARGFDREYIHVTNERTRQKLKNLANGRTSKCT